MTNIFDKAIILSQSTFVQNLNKNKMVFVKPDLLKLMQMLDDKSHYELFSIAKGIRNTKQLNYPLEYKHQIDNLCHHYMNSNTDIMNGDLLTLCFQKMDTKVYALEDILELMKDISNSQVFNLGNNVSFVLSLYLKKCDDKNEKKRYNTPESKYNSNEDDNDSDDSDSDDSDSDSDDSDDSDSTGYTDDSMPSLVSESEEESESEGKKEENDGNVYYEEFIDEEETDNLVEEKEEGEVEEEEEEVETDYYDELEERHPPAYTPPEFKYEQEMVTCEYCGHVWDGFAQCDCKKDDDAFSIDTEPDERFVFEEFDTSHVPPVFRRQPLLTQSLNCLYKKPYSNSTYLNLNLNLNNEIRRPKSCETIQNEFEAYNKKTNSTSQIQFLKDFNQLDDYY